MFYGTYSRHNNQAMMRDANLFVTPFINAKSFAKIYFLRLVTLTIRILKVLAAIDEAICSRSRGTYALLSTNELQKNSITFRTFNKETWLELKLCTKVFFHWLPPEVDGNVQGHFIVLDSLGLKPEIRKSPNFERIISIVDLLNEAQIY